MVYRPDPVAGPVQDMSSGFWPGYRIVQVNFFFKKIKTTCKIKNKNQQVATGFFDRVLPGQPARPHRVFLFHVFFQPDPIPAPIQPDPGSIRRAGFKNYNRNHQIYIYIYQTINRQIELGCILIAKWS